MPMAEDYTQTASSLRGQLRELAAQVQPFPTFLGRNWVQAVEVEVGGAVGASRGCIVVCPDGELYELALRLLPGPEEVSDPSPAEELTPLDMPDAEYVVWAQAALKALAGYLR